MRSAVETQALCADHPDLWFPQSWEGKARAAHTCGHCPVLERCRRDLAETPQGLLHGAVMAGVAHNEHGRPVHWELPSVRCHRCWQPKAPKSLDAKLREVGRA